MPSTTRTFGLILIVLGLASYFLTRPRQRDGADSGILRRRVRHPRAGCAKRVGAQACDARRGGFGAARISRHAARHSRSCPWGVQPPAVLAQLAMMVLMAIYVALGVKSFKAARRARLAR